ncbi:MAG: response regulator transcription factor [Proteobacteria bacterium]|nr:MAG: response regulator transcription factor [Pseudomonadota bacterium]
MQSILCVEDSPDAVLLLERALAGYRVDFVSSLAEAREPLLRQDYAMILLDLGLPDGTGLDLLVQVKAQARRVPVICISGATDFESKASAFTLGAEDFIMKPFDPREVRLRVDAKFENLRQQSASAGVLQFGTLRCDLETQRVTYGADEKALELTTLEFRILTMLAKNPARVFSRAEILERVWGAQVSVTERAVDVHVSNLRKKLKNTGASVEAVINEGYRFQSA